jgi:hypothetical protein
LAGLPTLVVVEGESDAARLSSEDRPGCDLLVQPGAQVWPKVKDAPNAEADGELSQKEEAALYRHYRLDYSEYRSESGLSER